MSTKNSILAGLLFLSFSFFAQDSDSFKDKEFSLFVGPSITDILNDNIKQDQYANTRGANRLNFGFNYSKYFNKNFGFVLGVEYSGYKNITDYRGSFWSTSTKEDQDGYMYYAVSEANYTDTRIVHMCEIPLQLRVQGNINSKTQFFVDAGIRMDFVVSAKLKQKGTFETKGAYPHSTFDNVYLLIEEEPYYGFKSYYYNSSKDIGTSKANFAYTFGFGVKTAISDKAFIVFNPIYSKTFTDLVFYNSRTDYVDVFGEKKAHSKYLLRQFAIRFGVGFYL